MSDRIAALSAPNTGRFGKNLPLSPESRDRGQNQFVTWVILSKIRQISNKIGPRMHAINFILYEIARLLCAISRMVFTIGAIQYMVQQTPHEIRPIGNGKISFSPFGILFAGTMRNRSLGKSKVPATSTAVPVISPPRTDLFRSDLSSHRLHFLRRQFNL
jgi:hypothetical protein